jgi:GxxExxY protein
MDKEKINALTGQILDACIEVHRHLGPGLLESVYVYALIKELALRGISTHHHAGVELIYKGESTGKFFEMDLLVEGEIVVEVKAVLEMHPVFTAQLLSYLKLSNKKIGILVNFNVVLLKDGFRRIVHNF